MELMFTSRDGTRLAARCWEAQDPVRGSLLIVHGLGEYGAKYVSLAREMAARGYSTCAMDLRGFGLSGGPRGHAEDPEQLLDDLEAFRLAAGRHLPEPCFLLGHSMGGALVAAYGVRRQPPVDGIILSGVLIRRKWKPDPLRRLVLNLAGRLMPGFTFPFDIYQAENGRSLPVRQENRDPLTHDRISGGLYLLLEDLGKQLQQTVLEGIPLLTIHGEADSITDPEAAAAFTRRCGGTMILWPGGGHTLHRGATRKEFADRLEQWMGAARKERKG